MWYLVDGQTIRSLKTSQKGVAEQLLRLYNQGNLSLDPMADYCGTLGLASLSGAPSNQNQTVADLQNVNRGNLKEDWLRGRDLNPGPQGYEPCELPDCSTPRHELEIFFYPACWTESS